VYGPRDAEFLRLFRAVRAHLLPRPRPPQVLSLVFVRDLAAAVVVSLEHPAALNQTYFVASRETATAESLAREIAAQLKVWTIPLPVPLGGLMVLCLLHELKSRLLRTPSVLSWQKFAEIRAPGWVCDPSAFERATGRGCPTPLAHGIAETRVWYQRHHWL